MVPTTRAFLALVALAVLLALGANARILQEAPEAEELPEETFEETVPGGWMDVTDVRTAEGEWHERRDPKSATDLNIAMVRGDA